MRTEHRITWVASDAAKANGDLEIQEIVIDGSLADAINHAVELAKQARFMLGQILSKDGKILANLAPKGHIRLSSG